MMPLTQRNPRFIETCIVEQNLETTDSINAVKEYPNPITGYNKEPLLPLAEACAPLANIINDLWVYVQLALDQTSDKPSDGLTVDESASIRLYTIEWNGSTQSLYSMLNYALRMADREALRPYFKYLKLFLTALIKLPCVPPQIVWRGVAADLSKDFPPGALVTWWQFSSCTTSLTVLKNNMYLGNVGERTLFSVEAIDGRTIRAHSYFVSEDEILLLPGTSMKVQAQLSPAPGLQIIHLKQIKPIETLLEHPFEDNLVYPSEKKNMLWCKNKRINSGLSLIIILCLAGIIIGSVVGTRRSSSSLSPSPNSTCKPSFPKMVSNKTGNMPVSIAAGDFNGDFKLDLVVCNNGDNTVSVFLNDGNGNLATQTTLPTGLAPQSIALGDFNNDSTIDLIVSNYDNSSISIFLGLGDGTFAIPSLFPAGSSYSIATGYFNNDTELDVAVAVYNNNTLGILLGYGNGSFGRQTTFPTSSHPLSVIVADFNRDNYSDIAVTNNSTVDILLGYGNGSFVTQIPLQTGSHPTLIVAGDFNNDNAMDLAVVNNDNQTIGVYLGYGNGNFTKQMTLSTGFTPLSMILSDFNGDRIPDFAIGNQENSTVSILLGYGDGTFAEQSIFQTGSKPQAIAAGDFNGDNLIDLAIANAGNNSVGILLNTCQ